MVGCRFLLGAVRLLVGRFMLGTGSFSQQAALIVSGAVGNGRVIAIGCYAVLALEPIG